ncbi:MAG: hypothetical protein C4539_02075 [Ignavibacteriales bacterium]|nr:MAG: hypothetical protein C4539_02075 [Ignavibacteriales bacterium]
MEIVYIGYAWFMMWYIVKIKREMSRYRKYLNQHNDIYVPSYKEITENQHWSSQLINTIGQNYKSRQKQNRKLIFPDLRRRISNISVALVEKRD